ncbi:MAG: hypothetical protein Q7S53_01925 [bacterium]|nr:hypothetical protein [bacterium]
MDFSVASFDFRVDRKDSKTLGNLDGKSTKYSLPIEGLIHLIITEDDGSVSEREVECTGWMLGNHFELSGKCFISPRVKFRCVLTEELQEGFEKIEMIAPNVVFGFSAEEWFMGNSGVN